MRSVIIILIWISSTVLCIAGETRIAVAANFMQAAREIGEKYEQSTGHKAIFSFGSTGQLYTQISQYAPYDIFLSADQARAEKAVIEGFAAADSRFTYAGGKIALFSLNKDLIKDARSLTMSNFTRLAIANPVTAPYGKAAVETLEKLGIYQALKDKIVKGNNIAQTYQFIHTENAELGFVALSQVIGRNEGSRWIVPTELYSAIFQDAVLLKTGADNEAAKDFLDFLKKPAARKIIEKYGYHA